MRGVVALAVMAGCGFDPSGSSAGDPDAAGQVVADAAAGAPDAADGELDAAPPPPACATPWVDEATGCHQYIKTPPAAFDAAEADCELRGGHLVVEDAEGEFSAVAAGMGPLGEADRFWIGLRDPAPDDNVFVWVDGQALAPEQEHWAGTEPSNSGDCVNARPDGTWGDRSCAEAKPYVCEKDV